MKKNNVLIIENDPFYQCLYPMIIPKDWNATICSHPVQAIQKSQKISYQLAIVDLCINGFLDGLKLIEALTSKNIYVAVVSSSADDETAIKAINLGCQIFIKKQKLKSEIPRVFQTFNLIHSKDQILQCILEKFQTRSSFLIDQISGLLTQDFQRQTIHLTGPTGVGKTTLAQALHETLKPDAPFIHLNCSEIPENLIESELFGHKKGSFTGASYDKIGKLQAANQGTLFLDEIGTISLQMQQKLLNAIETQRFYPIGSNSEFQSSFNLITATCEDISEKIIQGSFRVDFYERIKGYNIHIPALKERLSDISMMIENYLNQQARKIIIAPEGVKYLCSLPWEGNNRELLKFLKLLVQGAASFYHRDDLISILEKNPALPIAHSQLLTAQQIAFIETYGLRDFNKAVEQEMVKKTLAECSGKVTECIKKLKVSSSAVYRIMANL